MPADEPPWFAPRNAIDRDIAARLLALWRRSHHRWKRDVRAEFEALVPMARVTRGTCKPSSHLIVRKSTPPRCFSYSSSGGGAESVAAVATKAKGGKGKQAGDASGSTDVPSYAVFLVLVTTFGLQPLTGYGWWDAFRRKHPSATTYTAPGAVPANAAQLLFAEEVAAAAAANGGSDAREVTRYQLRGSARRARKLDYRKKSNPKSPQKEKKQKQNEHKGGEKRGEKKRDAKTEDTKAKDDKKQKVEGEKGKEKKNDKERKDEKKVDEKNLKEEKDREPKNKKQKKEPKVKAEPDDDQDNDVIYISSAESSPVKREPSPRETVDFTMPAIQTKTKHSDSTRDKRKKKEKKGSDGVGASETSKSALPQADASKHSSSKRDKRKGPDEANASAGTGGVGEMSAPVQPQTEMPKHVGGSKGDQHDGSKRDKKRGPDAMDVDAKIEGSAKMNAPTLPPTKKPALAGPATASSTTAETQGQHNIGRRAAGSPPRDAPRGPRILPPRGYENPRDSWQPRQLESRRSSTSWQTYFPVVRREPQDTPCPRQQHALPPRPTAHPQHATTQALSRPSTAAAPAVPSPADKVWDDLSKLKSSATVTSAAAPTPPVKDEQSVQDLKGQVAQLKKTNRDLWGRIGSLEEKARKQAGEVEALNGRVQMLAEVVARQARG